MPHHASTTPPAWSDQDLNASPHDRGDKAQRVQAMFAAIARRSDLNNRLHSLWQDQLWRRHAVKAADPKPGARVLDCACGTGDLTQAFARHPNTVAVVGSDFTPQMLDLARVKQQRLKRPTSDKITYEQADAMALPHDDASFDVVSIAFGIRNVQHPEQAMAEFSRVLKPGGRLVILEFDTPRLAPVRWFNSFYAGWVMPRTATLIARDRSGAYKYLPKSVGTFMPAAKLRELAEASGLTTPRSRALSMGICVCTTADKPA
ncbi:MAG: ubiquinone/menaquinone biosynthesis methyltransferase [Phycisphaerales bacterium JB040]